MVTKFVLNLVLHRVGLSWIIETNQQLEYDIYKHNPYWITDGLWYNTYICKKLHGTLFEKYIRNERIDIYNLICSIGAHEKQQPSYVDDCISDGVNAILSNLKTEALSSLGETFYFIDYWLKYFDKNYQTLSNIYIEAMQYLFDKISVQLPNPLSTKLKRQS